MLADAHASRQHVLLSPQVPKHLRPLLAGKAQIWKSLRTSDLDQTKFRSLEEGQRVERMFQALTLRAHSAQTDPESLARLYSSRAEAEDAAWRAKRQVEDDEQLDVELDALTSAVEDHTEALKLRDVDLVSKLLDEVLIDFKDRCRAAGLSEELHDALTRHSGGSVGRRYGLGPSLPVLAEALGRVSFPELKE